MSDQGSAMENLKFQAQARRKQDRTQWLQMNKKDELPEPTLFGPPIKITKNDPLTHRIKDVLGDHKNMQRYIQSSSLIGVDRLPQTPAGIYPAGTEQLFPMPPPRSDKVVEGSTSSNTKPGRDRTSGSGLSSSSSSSSKATASRRSRSRSKEKGQSHDKVIQRSQSLDGPGKNCSPSSAESKLSQESGYITGGSLEALNESESTSSRGGGDNVSSKSQHHSSSHSSSSRKEKERRSSSNSGHDPRAIDKPPGGRSSNGSRSKDAAKGLPPLKIPHQKKKNDGSGDHGDNIAMIFGEVSLQPPLTAIKTPGKEAPLLTHAKKTEVVPEKSIPAASKNSAGAHSLRRASSGGWAKDLQVSSDSDEDTQQQQPETQVKAKSSSSAEKSTAKKESGKRSKKMSAQKGSLSDSSDGSGSDSDSESDSAPGSASDSSSSEDEAEEKLLPTAHDRSNNSSRNQSSGSGGLFGVPEDQPEEKPTGFSYNLGNYMRRLKETNIEGQPDLISPIKDQPPFPSSESSQQLQQKQQQQQQPADHNRSSGSSTNANYNEGINQCFQDILNNDYGKLSPCPTLRRGSEGDNHDDEHLDITDPPSSKSTEDLKVTSTSNSKAKSSSDSSLLHDFNKNSSFGIARITQSDNDDDDDSVHDSNDDFNPSDSDSDDEEIKEIHRNKVFSPPQPQHSPFKPISISGSSPHRGPGGKSSANSFRSNASSNNKTKTGSTTNSESIPASEAKPPDKKSSSNSTSSKSKSKKSQSSSNTTNSFNNSDSNNTKVSNQKPVKQDSSGSRQKSNSSKSPARSASSNTSSSKKEKKSKANAGSNAASVVGTPTKKGRKPTGTKATKALSREFIPSSDSSSDLEPEKEEDSYVDIEGFSPDKDKGVVIKSSSPKTNSKAKSSELIAESKLLLSSPVKSVKSEPETVSSKQSVKYSSSKSKQQQQHHKDSTNNKSLDQFTFKRNLSGNSSSLDLSHILSEFSAPDELLSPVPSLVPALEDGVKPGLYSNKLSSSKSTTMPVLSRQVAGDGIIKKERDVESVVGVKASLVGLSGGVRYVGGIPSIIVSIDLNLVDLPNKAFSNVNKNSKDSPYSDTSDHHHQHFTKGSSGDTGNIFQNLNKALKLNLTADNDDAFHQIRGQKTLSEDNFNPPSNATNASSLVTPDEEQPPYPNPFGGYQSSHTHDFSADHNKRDTLDTNSASTDSRIPLQQEVAEVVKPPKPQPVDVSTIIDLEGLPPPSLKIPKKRKPGDNRGERSVKKPRTDDRYRERSPLSRSGLDSPQYGGSKRDHAGSRSRQGSRESRDRYSSKRSRMEETAGHHDEASHSPSVPREAGRSPWSQHGGSDYRRTTPRYDDYSDRDSIQHDDDPWADPPAGKEDGYRDRRGGADGRRYDRDRDRDRDKWREQRTREYYDKQKNRKYSRDWDAPGEETYPETHSPAYPPAPPPPERRGVASQWGDLAAGHTTLPQPAPSSGYGRHDRIYEDERGGGGHYRRNKVAPVNEKLESANDYLNEAKALKHQADKITEKNKKMIVYVDAFLSFIQCGNAMEQDGVSETTKIIKMYQDTLRLIRYCMVGHDGTDKPDNIMIKKLAVFSFRIQAVLCLRLYKLKKTETAKLKKIIDCHNKSANSKPIVQAPSPYSSHTSSTSHTASSSGGGGGGGGGGSGGGGWKATSGTPSPMSPQPSPAGSVDSVRSVGSDNNPKGLLNGNNVSSTTVCVPQRIHSVTQEYLKGMETLYKCHEAWDQADVNMEDKEFFDSLDRDCGRLSLQSNVPEIVRYIKEGINRLKKHTT